MFGFESLNESIEQLGREIRALSPEEKNLLHELHWFMWEGPRRTWLQMLWVQITGAA